MAGKFWMVLGDGYPIVRHVGYDQALAEAKRLAKQNETRTFYVLESVAEVKYDPFRVEMCELGEGMPF